MRSSSGMRLQRSQASSWRSRCPLSATHSHTLLSGFQLRRFGPVASHLCRPCLIASQNPSSATVVSFVTPALLLVAFCVHYIMPSAVVVIEIITKQLLLLSYWKNQVSMHPYLLTIVRFLTLITSLEFLKNFFMARLQLHIVSSPNFNQLQSAYRQLHSTETALLHTLDAIYRSSDQGRPTVLISNWS